MNPRKAPAAAGPTIDYDSVADIYDVVRTGNPEMIHQILTSFETRPDSTVLDVGCGTGNNAVLFRASTKSRVIGIDLSRGMLEHAASKTRSVEFINCPADRLPFERDRFDLVFMTEVIHHLDEVLPALCEVYRVLRHGGRLCVVTQSHRQIEDRMTSRFFPSTTRVDKERYPDIDVIEELMQEAGFEKTWHATREFVSEVLGDDYLETVSRRGYSMLHKISA
ncbi:MAG: class I SAM-dependent methyltransferase, partial [Candidatus Thorarchaeota archaeon]